MVRDDVMLAIWAVNVVRRLLLLMFKVPTVIKSIPFRVVKKVLVIVTLFDCVMGPGSVSDERAGSADQKIVPTEVNSVNCRVDIRVMLNRLNSPPMLVIVLLVREIKFPAFADVMLPVTCPGPLISMMFAASGPIRMDPFTVLHEARAVASACELMVTVEAVQTLD